MAFDVGSISAKLTLDRSEFIRELEQAHQQGRDFASERFEAKLALSILQFTAELDKAKNQLREFAQQKATVTIDGNASPLERAISDARRALDVLRQQSARITIDGDASPLERVISAARARLAQLARQSATITIDGNMTPFLAAYRQVLALIANLNRQRVNITFDGNKVPFDQKNQSVKRDADQTGREHPTVTFNGNDTPFNTTNNKVRANAAATGRLHPTVDINANDRGFNTVDNNVRRRALSISRLRPMVIFAAISNPFEAVFMGVMRKIRDFVRIHTARFRADTQDADRNVTHLGNSVRGATNLWARMRNLMGRDSSLFTRIGNAVAGMADRIMGGFTGIAETATAASGGLSRVAMGLGGTAVSGGLAAGAGAAAAGALSLLASVVSPLVAMLGVGVATIGAVGIGLGTVGGAALLAGKDFGQLQQATTKVRDAQKELELAKLAGDTDRVKDATKELATAENNLTRIKGELAGKSNEYMQALVNLQTQVDNFKQKATEAFVPAATQMANLGSRILESAQQYLPMLGQAASQNLTALEQGFTKSATSSGSFKGILDQLPPIMSNFGQISGNVWSALIGFLNAAMPLVDTFTSWAAQASQKLAEWANSEEGRAQIKQWLDQAIPIAKMVAEKIGEIATKLWELGEKYGPTAVKVIGSIIDGFISFLDWGGQVIQWVLDFKQKWDESNGFVKTIVTGLWEFIKAAFNAGITILGGIMDTIEGLLTGDWGLISQGVKAIVDGLVDLVIAALEGLVTFITGGYGTKLIQAITAPFKSAETEVVGASIVPDMVSGVQDWMNQIPENSQAPMQDYYSNTTAQFAATTRDANDALVQLTEQVIHTYGDGDGQVAGWARSQMQKYQDSVTSAFITTTQKATSSMTQMAQAVVNGINKIIETANSFQAQWETIGSNYMVGLVNGLRSQEQSLYDDATRIGNNVTTSMNNAMGNQSPSWKAFDAMVNYGQGLVNGLRKMKDPVLQASHDLAQTVMAPFSSLTLRTPGLLSPGATVGPVDALQGSTPVNVKIGAGANFATPAISTNVISPGSRTSSTTDSSSALHTAMDQLATRLESALRRVGIDNSSAARIGQGVRTGVSGALSNDREMIHSVETGQNRTLRRLRWEGTY